MTLRVVHWGTGTTGREALRGIIGSPKLELVGLLVQRPENAGKDAGDLCGCPKTGILATNSIDAGAGAEARLHFLFRQRR